MTRWGTAGTRVVHLQRQQQQPRLQLLARHGMARDAMEASRAQAASAFKPGFKPSQRGAREHGRLAAPGCHPAPPLQPAHLRLRPPPRVAGATGCYGCCCCVGCRRPGGLARTPQPPRAPPLSRPPPPAQQLPVLHGRSAGCSGVPRCCWAAGRPRGRPGGPGAAGRSIAAAGPRQAAGAERAAWR